MIAWFRCLLLAVLLTTPIMAHARPLAPAIDPDRQILVMLRLAPAHFRSGGAYGGGYGDDQARGGRQRIAAAIARRHGLTVLGDWPMPIIGIDCFIMFVSAGRSADAAASEVTRDSAVQWAQPVALYHALGGDGADPLFAAQPTARAWHLAALHRFATGRGVKIAVVDSQVEVTHPDLIGQIASVHDFVVGRPTPAEDHGTGIAGVIAAKARNGLGIAGIAPDAKLLALRACWQTLRPVTVCDTLSLAKAIAFAVEQRADVINLSLSGPSDRLLAVLLKAGMAHRAVVVAAFDKDEQDGGFPASLGGVVAVAGAPIDGTHRPYWAPGHDVPTTQPGGRWYLVSGASYAAAEVTGLVALVRQHYRALPIAHNLVSDRIVGGEINGCATLLGGSPACYGAPAMRDPR